MNKKCEQCGTDFSPSKHHPKQRFCSKECNAAWYYGQGTGHKYTCRNCGQEYTAKHKSRNKYCSRECAFAAKVAKPEAPRMQKCRWCGADFEQKNGAHFCSDGCRKDDARNVQRMRDAEKKQSKPHKCKECSEVFVPEYGNKRRSFCSEICLKRHNGRIAKSTRRARIRGASTVEDIDPIAVFERDKWECHICGKRTQKRLRGTVERLAPELDHVIPLSKGGTHTYDNVACSCRRCNGIKSDRIIGQLGLFATGKIDNGRTQTKANTHESVGRQSG